VSEVLIVRKGSAGKLFNTETQQSITFAEVQALLDSGRDVRVLLRPGDVDITSSVLLELLARMERKEPRLPATLVSDLMRYRQRGRAEVRRQILPP
jgi:polyhydroxyalkanoate synthesis regulator protein